MQKHKEPKYLQQLAHKLLADVLAPDPTCLDRGDEKDLEEEADCLVGVE